MTLRPYPPASQRTPELIRHRSHQQTAAPHWPRLVLLVEDEPFVREATRGILESVGFEVLSVADPDAAIKTYEESTQPVDLVMTDMILPGRTGRQLGEDLRQRSPNQKVLVTSGYSQAEYAADEPQSRTYFLAKPYSRRGLVAKIQEIFIPPSEALPLRQAVGQAG